MVETALVILVILFVPRLMRVLSEKHRFFGTLGPVFLCYAVGLAASFIITDASVPSTATELLVPVAIPLILFSADFSAMRRMAKPAIISFLLMIGVVSVVTGAAYFVFRGSVDDAAKVSGMLAGLYTGGTPNLMAIGMALNVNATQIGLANTADMLAGGVYFFLLISVIPALVRRFAPKPVAAEDGALAGNITETYVPERDKGFILVRLLNRFKALGAAVACLAVAAGAALLITGELNVAIIMLLVTSFGVALSFVPFVRRLPKSYSTGQYLIYMFSVALGMCFDLSMLSGEAVMLLVMVLAVQFGSVALHFALARLCRIDAGTAVITSTAGIYGPAFIAPVAGALKDDSLTLPGLLCGILGYGVGNYLGIGIAGLLALL